MMTVGEAAQWQPRANDKQTTKAAQCAVESDPFLIQIYTAGFQQTITLTQLL
jgi:hypothetical protein